MDTSFLTGTNEQVSQAITDLAASETEVKRLEALQEKQVAKETELQAEVKQLESEMGEKILSALEAGRDNTKAVAAEVDSKRTQAEAAKAVSYALLPKLAHARKAAISAKAAVLRAEADRLELVAISRQAETDEMLKKLQDFEGCRYTFYAGQPPQQPTGGRHIGGALVAFIAQVPLTLKLFSRAGALREDARLLEAGLPRQTDIYSGGWLAPFEIDYEGGRVLIPAPVEFKPPERPAPVQKEVLPEKPVKLENPDEWKHLDMGDTVVVSTPSRVRLSS